MKKIKKKSFKVALTAALGATACSVSAFEVHPLGTNMPAIDFHGFASQGLLYSGDYDYLGFTKSGSAKFTEAGVNVSADPFPHTHVTVQGFLFDVGNVGEYRPTLDYALIDYNFSDKIGIRAGRIIRPEGIYNAIQSIDLARTSILLPQGMYDARFRDFSGAIDGGSIYGDIGLSKAGDLSYEVYGGLVTPEDNGGIARTLEDSLNNPPYTYYGGISDFPEVGVQLWWNTPVNGLRAGLAVSQSYGFNYRFTAPFGPGAVKNVFDASTAIHPSLEYVWKNWTFQAEYSLSYFETHSEIGGASVNYAHNASDTWYAGAAYRFNKWFETGVYYTEYYGNTENRDGAGTAVPSDAFQKDAALSFRFDITPWWVAKLEGHAINGTALLRDGHHNPNRNDSEWFMLAVKTTVSF